MDAQDDNDKLKINDYDMFRIIQKFGIPVMDLNISLKTIDSLIKAGIRNVGELLLCSKEDLINIKNLGKNGVYEVIDQINAMGFNFPLTESQKEKVRQKMELRESNNVRVKKSDIDSNQQSLLKELRFLIEQKRKIDEESRNLEIRIEAIINELDTKKTNPKQK